MHPSLNYRLFFDGICRGDSTGGAGVVLINPAGLIRFQLSHPLTIRGGRGGCTAKYLALSFGLEYLTNAVPLDLGNLEIVSDSRLLIGQLRGEFPIVSAVLQKLNSRVADLLKELPSYSITFIPKKYNRLAHFLAGNAITSFLNS